MRKYILLFCIATATSCSITGNHSKELSKGQRKKFEHFQLKCRMFAFAYARFDFYIRIKAKNRKAVFEVSDVEVSEDKLDSVLQKIIRISSEVNGAPPFLFISCDSRIRVKDLDRALKILRKFNVFDFWVSLPTGREEYFTWFKQHWICTTERVISFPPSELRKAGNLKQHFYDKGMKVMEPYKIPAPPSKCAGFEWRIEIQSDSAGMPMVGKIPLEALEMKIPELVRKAGKDVIPIIIHDNEPILNLMWVLLWMREAKAPNYTVLTGERVRNFKYLFHNP